MGLVPFYCPPAGGDMPNACRRRLAEGDRMRDKLRGLYVIIDPAVARGRDEVEVAREALDGGARLIQLRDKTREKGLQLPVAEALQALCRERGALVIVNEHVDLALAAGAHGVHVGQKDLPVAVVRRLVPREMVIGCSTNNPEEARPGAGAGRAP